MEKLLYKENRLQLNLIDEIIEAAVYHTINKICGWVFLGMAFSKNINGQIFNNPSIELTFSSNICDIPDRLLPSRACFRLGRQCESSVIFPTRQIIYTKCVPLKKNDYFCKLIRGLKKCVNVYQQYRINDFIPIVK
jgi:hypothetical protein